MAFPTTAKQMTLNCLNPSWQDESLRVWLTNSVNVCTPTWSSTLMRLDCCFFHTPFQTRQTKWTFWAGARAGSELAQPANLLRTGLLFRWYESHRRITANITNFPASTLYKSCSLPLHFYIGIRTWLVLAPLLPTGLLLPQLNQVCGLGFMMVEGASSHHQESKNTENYRYLSMFLNVALVAFQNIWSWCTCKILTILGLYPYVSNPYECHVIYQCTQWNGPNAFIRTFQGDKCTLRCKTWHQSGPKGGSGPLCGCHMNNVGFRPRKHLFLKKKQYIITHSTNHVWRLQDKFPIKLISPHGWEETDTYLREKELKESAQADRFNYALYKHV